MNQVLQGRPMTIFGDGKQTRAFSHVDDVAPLIARAPLVPAAMNEVFNVGADTPYTVMELAENVAAAFGTPLAIEHLPPRQEVEHAFSEHSKARRVFEPPPCIDLKTGIARMAAWVRSRGPAIPAEFGNIELHKNLPAAWLRS